MSVHEATTRSSLSARLTALSVGIMVLAALCVAAVSVWKHSHDFERSLAFEARLLVERVAHEIRRDPRSLTPAETDAVADLAFAESKVVYLRIIAPDGSLVAERRADGSISPPAFSSVEAAAQRSTHARHGRTAEGAKLVDAMTPIRLLDRDRAGEIMAASEPGTSIAATLGYVQLGMLAPRSMVLASQSSHITELASFIVAILVVCSLLIYALVRRQTRPMREVIRATREIAGGNFDAAIPVGKGSGETDELSDAMRTMVSRMNEYRSELASHRDELEDRVEERTRQLRVRTDEALELAERADESSRTKSRFVANMSHEIRTPMNGVLGMASLLAETELSDKQSNYVNTLHESATDLLGIIDDILDFSKVEGGYLEFAQVPLSVSDMIDGVARSFVERADRAETRLVSWVAEDVPFSLMGDPLRVAQILRNFVSNSIKFTEGGEVVVRATLAGGEQESKPAPGESAVLEFSVSDTGVGIEGSRQKTIFDPFTQADESLTRRFGGTGLGLTICKQLTESMDGEVGFESEPGRGSRFWVRIPFAVLGDDSAPEATSNRSQVLDCRVLVCSEEGTECDVALDYLSRRGVEAMRASNGTQITEALDSGAVNRVLALLDTDLLAGELAEALARAARRPFVAVGAGSRVMLPAALSEVVDVHLDRPVSIRAVSEFLSAELASSGDRLEAGKGRREGFGGGASMPRFDARVLVAEDNPINQMVARELIEGLGCSVSMVGTGDRAVRAVSEEKFDLVFMDCQMPVMDGIAATVAIRSLEERQGLPRIPIIALTAHTLAVSQDDCLEAGMDFYVRKPFSAFDLARALGGFLDPVDGSSAPAEREALPTSSSSAVLRLSALDEIRGFDDADGDDEFLTAVVESYLVETEKLLEQLAGVVSEGAADRVERIAHAMKSSSLQIGLLRLGEVAGRMESESGQGNLVHAEANLEEVRFEFAQAAEALRVQVLGEALASSGGVEPTGPDSGEAS